MCALIYTKLTDKTVVLAPREGLCRQFNFGDDWTETRLGMICSAVADTGPNNNNVDETVVYSSYADYITFGFKDSGQTYPGQAGSLFIGLRSGDTQADSFGTVQNGMAAPGGLWNVGGYHDTTFVSGGAAQHNGTMGGSASASSVSSYASFMGIRFVINNRGLSSQTIDVYNVFTSPVSGTDYSATALRTLLNNSVWGTATNFAWNTGAAARDIPDCLWVRAPFFSNSLRLSSIRAIRYAP